MNVFSRDAYLLLGFSSLLPEKTRKTLYQTDAVILDDGHYFFYILDRNKLNAALKDKSVHSLITSFFEFNQYSYIRNNSKERILQHAHNYPVRPSRFLERKLTPRETEVMTCYFNGETTQDIALKYSMDKKVVSNHKQSALRKMNIKNTAILIRTMAGWFEIIINYLQNQTRYPHNN